MLSLLCSSPSSSDSFDKYAAGPRGDRPLKGRRMSLQLGPKKRRVVKGSIGSPADFRHSGHVGPRNMHLLQSQPELWDVESWKVEIQTSMQQVMMAPVSEEGPRPLASEPVKLYDGPKPRVDKLKRPLTAPDRAPPSALSSDTVTAAVSVAVSQPPSPTKAQHRASTSFPTPPRRKPAPEVTQSVLNAVAKMPVSPTIPATFTLVPDLPPSSPTPAPVLAPPLLSNIMDTTVTTPLTTNDQVPASVKPLVPLLNGNSPPSEDIPRVYVTQTTKAKWDGAMEEIALALKHDST